MSGVSLAIKALLSRAAVKAITGTRVYPFPLPPKTRLPAIAVAMAGEDDEYMLDGAGQYPETSLQFHCVAATAKAAIELGEVVKQEMRDLHYTAAGADALFTKEALDYTDFATDLSTHRRIMGFSNRWR
ncbi:MAG: DUF3168 domain-containing protein [Mesorhizobium sp.]|uniref:tail completion protein gp17 n=1 Tax=Mesorhizobium sp. M7A.F.Ca.ET.027.02.1.1 TaxID=2496655 RepID=UPI000FD2E52B|nr:DUF3168 domain-containing protein [Mesorhizobium sp. M7A.F.Ca.ET.027.02.1.1]RVD16865.1 DUF3168 domain-containing protein [Mesorhizobium sp. M7A.F.Ca.ET.027.02.1.1]RWD00503.1 MAG: DUF3168 domain-containing protein [Mesorhizobium sp.]